LWARGGKKKELCWRKGKGKRGSSPEEQKRMGKGGESGTEDVKNAPKNNLCQTKKRNAKEKKRGKTMLFHNSTTENEEKVGPKKPGAGVETAAPTGGPQLRVQLGPNGGLRGKQKTAKRGVNKEKENNIQMFPWGFRERVERKPTKHVGGCLEKNLTLL